MKPDQPESNARQTLALFWQFTKAHKLLFWYATIGSALSSIVSDIIPPLIIAEAFDKLQTLYTHHQIITFASMRMYFLLYTVVTIAGIVMWQSQAYVAWKYCILTAKSIMNHIFNHLQHMDSRFH